MILIGQDHPTICKLIEVLQTDCSRVHSILMQDERGIRPKKRTKKVYTELQKRLFNLCQDRINGHKTIPEFLFWMFPIILELVNLTYKFE